MTNQAEQRDSLQARVERATGLLVGAVNSAPYRITGGAAHDSIPIPMATIDAVFEALTGRPVTWQAR